MELFAASLSASDGTPRFEGGVCGVLFYYSGVLFYYSPRPPEGFGGRENGKIIHFGLFGSSGNFYSHEPARKNRIFEPTEVIVWIRVRRFGRGGVWRRPWALQRTSWGAQAKSRATVSPSQSAYVYISERLGGAAAKDWCILTWNCTQAFVH